MNISKPRSQTASKMSQIFSFHLILFALTIFMFPLFMLSRRSKSRKDQMGGSYNLPPGPWKLPIIGNLHQLAGSSLPHRSFRDLSGKFGPIVSLKFGEILTVVVSSKESAREFLQTHELVFAQRPVTLGMEAMSFARHGGLVGSPYGEYWRQMRRLCAAAVMRPKRVESFRRLREEEAWRLVESVCEVSSQGRLVNLSEIILSTATGTVSRAVCGEISRGHDEYVSLLKEVLKLSTGFTVADCFPSVKFLGLLTGIKAKLERIQRKASSILDDIVVDHKTTDKSSRAQDEEDLIDVLLRMQQSNELKFEVTTDHIKTVIMDVIGAGGETTATALEWAMSEMLKNRSVFHKAQAEIRRVLRGKTKIEEPDIHDLNYLKFVIKETLRLHPPAPLLGRESRESCRILGFDVPEKAKIMINAWALGRDPAIWGPNAECFVPERFIGSSVDPRGTHFEYLPFGAGRRVCPGISFSWPNMELVLAQLLYHFDWGLPNGGKLEDLDMSEEYKVSCRRKVELCLVATIVVPFSG